MNAPRYQVRRERGVLEAGWLHANFSFSFGGFVHPHGDRFGPLLALNEDRVQPGTGFPMHPHRDLEILMLPLEGAIAHEDSLGHRLTVHTGQALWMRAGAGIAHSQFNASATQLDHHLQLWIKPDQRGLAPAIRLATLQPPLAGRWQSLAAPHGAPLPLAQAARVQLGRAAQDHPLPLQLGPATAGYLHVARGTCRVEFPDGTQEELGTGEALALASLEGQAVLAAAQDCDVLLVDFPDSLLLRNRTNAAVRAGR